MHRIIFHELLNDWGLSKTIQVCIIAIVGAGVGTIIAINSIPNKPNTINEKENYYE